jgi:hypothetical protein
MTAAAARLLSGSCPAAGDPFKKTAFMVEHLEFLPFVLFFSLAFFASNKKTCI